MSKAGSDKFRDEVFNGMPRLTRVPHTGNKWIVTLPDKYGGGRAVLKTSATASMMTSAESGDWDAQLIGIERNLDQSIEKLLAVMKTDDGVISYYLLDRIMVVKRLKDNHRIWEKRKPNRGNQARILYFRDYKLPTLDPYACILDEWRQYLVLSVEPGDVVEVSKTPQTRTEAVEAAKVVVAEAYGVSTDQVEISVKL